MFSNLPATCCFVDLQSDLASTGRMHEILLQNQQKLSLYVQTWLASDLPLTCLAAFLEDAAGSMLT